MPRVTFEPAGVAVDVEPGTSILDAARAAGVRIRNDCGGRGACGRCVVHIRSGEVARLSTRFDLREGEDLACRTLAVETDIRVFVPMASREVTEEVTVQEGEPAPAEFPPPESLVKNVRLRVRPPSLEDNVADDDRLLRALRQWHPARYRLPLGVRRDLPRVLRAANWEPNVTVSVGPEDWCVLKVGDGAARPLCMLAVDVGTTVLKGMLLAPGRTWQASCYNSQVMYGPDVISRIMYCQRKESGVGRMQHLVVGGINQLVGALERASGVSRRDIWGVVVSGNTTMTHLLYGLCPVWIRREPYVGCSYHLPPVEAAEVGIEINPLGRLFSAPSVSSYVGGDITAGVLAVGLAERQKPSMLIDLGTNGEIVIGNRDFLVCCSASAGPAFEGEASASGTRAMPGAIDAVFPDGDGGIRWHTIGGQPPVGICGSGYIDLLAVLLDLGVVDRTGRFQEGTSACLCRRDGDASLQCVLVEAARSAGGNDIVLTQGDIDNLVRAKGAIFAAARVLLESLGLGWDDMERIMLAGAFGERVDKENAVKIGLLPDVPRDRIEFVGNTSLQGATMAALDERNYAKLESVARKMTYLELSTHPDYMSEFVAACFLPHTDAERFPSITHTR